MSNGLDPDQDQLSVGPDPDPNCLQRLSEKTKVKSYFEYHLRLTSNPDSPKLRKICFKLSLISQVSAYLVMFNANTRKSACI